MDTIVVARYNEDISWLESIPGFTGNIHIYDKGMVYKTTNDKYTLNILKNIGREPHTYLHHILTNYDLINPNNITLFTQGNIHGHGLKISDIHCMITEAKDCGFSKSYAYPHKINIQHQPIENFRIYTYRKDRLEPNKYNESFKSWFERCLNQRFPCEKYFKWCIAAIFAVRNDYILQHPKSFYQKLLDEIPENISPEVAHFFERTWYYIFQQRLFYIQDVPKDINIKKSKVHVIQIDTRELTINKKEILQFPKCNGQPVFNLENEYFGINKDNMFGKNVHIRTNSKTQQSFVYKNNWDELLTTVNYHTLTYMMNSLQVQKNDNWSYEYIQVEHDSNRHPSWKKTYTLLQDLYRESLKQYDVVIVMDTDAWIRDINSLKNWIGYFVKEIDKYFMFAAEPYVKETFDLLNIEQQVNGGLMIFKPNNPKVYDFFNDVYLLPESNPIFSKFKIDWSFEQICMNFILQEHKSYKYGIIVVPQEKFNTPSGTVIAHCWWKHIIKPLLIHDLLYVLFQNLDNKNDM